MPREEREFVEFSIGGRGQGECDVVGYDTRGTGNNFFIQGAIGGEKEHLEIGIFFPFVVCECQARKYVAA